MNCLVIFIYKVFYYFMSIYVKICNYFSPKGIKYRSLYQITEDKYLDVSSQMDMDTLIPRAPLEKGCYCVCYSIDIYNYRRLFNNINPDMIAEKLPQKRKISTFTILSAFDHEDDVSELIKEYAGPQQDFYKDGNLKLKHLQVLHNINTLELMTSKLDEYLLENSDDSINVLK